MNIAITGASGFIGSRLSQYLTQKGYSVTPINRDILYDKERLYSVIHSSEVVINLAGATISKRWTKEYKQEILNSRVNTTRAIVTAINCSPVTTTLISTSACGIYADTGINDEYKNNYANTFLAQVCKAWEYEALQVNNNIRLVITRFGIVLAQDGGMMQKLNKYAKLGLGIIVGNGNQSLSWIYREDLISIMDYIINNIEMRGVYNLSAPKISTQRELTNLILHRYHPHIPPIKIPSILPQLFMGESSELLLIGQNAYPTRLESVNFPFKAKTLEDLFNIIL